MVENLEQITLERHLSLIMGKKIHFHNSEVSQLNPSMLKKSFFRRSHQYHPDKAALLGLDETYLTERFQNLQQAYTSVLDALNSGRIAKILDKNSSAEHRNSLFKKQPVYENFKKGKSSSVHPRVFHAGSIPPTRHRLAQYLYYIKKIDRTTLIKALSWQYSVRPKVGELATKAGYMNYNEVLDVIRSQTQGSLFCSTAVSLGYLTPYQRILIMGNQRLLNLPIGTFFLQNEILSETELTQVLSDLHQHNIRSR